jgi:hypothetical protein
MDGSVATNHCLKIGVHSMDLRIADVIGLTTRKDISRLSSACCAPKKYELLQSAPQPALHPGV